MKTDDLIRFYINNGTEKTVEMLKKEKKGDWTLRYIISFDKKTTGWAKEVAQHLLYELRKA